MADQSDRTVSASTRSPLNLWEMLNTLPVPAAASVNSNYIVSDISHLAKFGYHPQLLNLACKDELSTAAHKPAEVCPARCRIKI